MILTDEFYRAIPETYRQKTKDMFAKWQFVQTRNQDLTNLYRMDRAVKLLDVVDMPEQVRQVSCVMGWAKKAVDVMAKRSKFDGFVFAGKNDTVLDRMVKDNALLNLYDKACTASLTHGVSCFTVMAGTKNQPKAVVRAFSAQQSCVLWDKDKARAKCGVVLASTDRKGAPDKYIIHFSDAVLTMQRAGRSWSCAYEHNPFNTPLIIPMAYDADLDRPLGHSRITPSIISIIDKAMRDVLNMDVASAFYTYPQRYMLGLDQNVIQSPTNKDENGNYPEGSKSRMDLYLGRILALSKDEDGDIPQVGQFEPMDISNLTRMFENDAQRFSGESNVPLGQLGVLSNTYTSSDALGAANNPLILNVEHMNRTNARVLEDIARFMMAINEGCLLEDLPDNKKDVQALFKDPSSPTISATADAWTKIAAADKAIVGTQVFYENMGLAKATIDRLEAQKQEKEVAQQLAELGQLLGNETKQ
ncbi:hypothetical protein HMPREF3192_00992 [Atopobium deltae]|uniref:Phage portal protein, SPP1 Gp6 n=2 Tax=Atopobium deltae TaxID=1393034 RepID=A0A133XS51_9ACTN|nr:hypothetical protein HMPREF3192_00992 [Atopobium deltae]